MIRRSMETWCILKKERGTLMSRKSFDTLTAYLFEDLTKKYYKVYSREVFTSTGV